MSDGLTRPISFPNSPSWTELATSFMLSVVFLCVSYVDLDGHEVTLSSEEELCDFYNSNVDSTIQANQPIRFRVVRLGSIRHTDNFIEPTSPPQSSTRNTSGRPTSFVFVDHNHLPFNDIFISSPLIARRTLLMPSSRQWTRTITKRERIHVRNGSHLLPKASARPANHVPPFLTMSRPRSR